MLGQFHEVSIMSEFVSNKQYPISITEKGCPGAEAGTFRITRNPSNQSPNLRYLCFGDELSIIHNRDANLSGDPKPLTTPGIGYVFYDCKPTVDGPNLATVINDPCLNKKSPILINNIPVNQTQGMWIFKGDINGDIRYDQFRNDGFLQNTYNNGKPVQFWFAPITLDQFTTDNRPQFETDVNGEPGPCIDVNIDSAFSVVFLNEIQVSNITGRNGGPGNYTGTMTIMGGLPEFDGSNYPAVRIENIFDPTKTGRITNLPALHGKPITFTVPEPGRYQITMDDGTGCTLTQRLLVNISADNGLLKLNCKDAKVGESICVPITVSKMKELAAAQFTLIFNPQVLEYVRAQNLSPKLNSDLSQTVFDNQKSTGIIKFLWFELNLSPKDFSAESVLIEFCFNVIGPPGPHEFRITGSPVTLEFADIGGNPYPLGEGNGSIFKCNSMISLGSNLDAYFSQCGQTMFATIFGGTGPYTVKWEQDGKPESTVFNRFDQSRVTDTLMTSQPPGRYFISVTDSTGINIKDTINLRPGLTNLSINTGLRESASCKTNDGRIFVTASGGTPDYRFQWSNGSVSDRLTQLSAGTYFLTVTDAQGCTKSDSVSINQVNTVAAISIQRNPTCSGVRDGRILPDFSRISGIPPFSIEWQGDGIQIGNQFTGLGSNPSRLIITDFKGCSDTASITLAPAKKINILVEGDNPKCNGNTDGRLRITRSFSDGSAMSNDRVTITNSIGITISDLLRPAIFNDLRSGLYQINITDTLNCAIDTFIILTQPPIFDTAAVFVNLESCFPGNDGRIEIKLKGGTPPYRYTWSDINTNTNVRSGLSIGDYKVTITDANNCRAVFDSSNLLAFSINQTGKKSILALQSDTLKTGYQKSKEFDILLNDSILKGASVNVTIEDPQNGSIDYSKTTGKGTYTPRQKYFGKEIIHYTSCDLGCPGACQTSTIELNVDGPCADRNSLVLPNVIFPTGPTGANKYFYVEALDKCRDAFGPKPTKLLVYNRWGDLVFHTNDYQNNWDGSNIKGNPLPEGTYYYLLDLGSVAAPIKGYVAIVR